MLQPTQDGIRPPAPSPSPKTRVPVNPHFLACCVSSEFQLRLATLGRAYRGLRSGGWSVIRRPAASHKLNRAKGATLPETGDLDLPGHVGEEASLASPKRHWQSYARAKDDWLWMAYAKNNELLVGWDKPLDVGEKQSGMKTGSTISIAVAALCAGCCLGFGAVVLFQSATRPQSNLLPVSLLLREGTNRVVGTISPGDYFYSFTDKPLAFPFTLPKQDQRLFDGIESALYFDGESTLPSPGGRTNAGYVNFPIPRKDHLTFEILAVVTNADRIFLNVGRR